MMHAYVTDYLNHVIRMSRSLRDRFAFCHFQLERWSGWIFLAGLLGSLLSLAFRVGTLAVIIPVLTGIWAVYSKFFRSPKVEYPINRLAFEIMLNVRPTELERQLNFGSLPRPRITISPQESIEIVRDGPIIVSEDFNVQCIMNSSWDPSIAISNTSPGIYEGVVAHLRKHADIYTRIIQNRTWSSLFTRLPLINENKIGLCSNISDHSNEIKIYKTDYFCGILTANIVTNDIQEYRNGSPVTLSAATDRLPYHRHGDQYELADFDDFGKYCSHHLGIDVLAVTRDFCLPLMIQATHTQVSQGLLAPTGSGSVDWKDLGACLTLKEVLKVACERELREEATRQRGDPGAWVIEKIVPIGYFRMPHRAGKPQFTFLVKLNNNSTEMGPNREVTHVADLSRDATFFSVKNLQDLDDVSRDLITGGHRQYTLSVPLWGALVCLRHAISRYPDYLRSAVGFSAPHST